MLFIDSDASLYIVTATSFTAPPILILHPVVHLPLQEFCVFPLHHSAQADGAHLALVED